MVLVNFKNEPIAKGHGCRYLSPLRRLSFGVKLNTNLLQARTDICPRGLVEPIENRFNLRYILGRARLLSSEAGRFAAHSNSMSAKPFVRPAHPQTFSVSVFDCLEKTAFEFLHTFVFGFQCYELL